MDNIIRSGATRWWTAGALAALLVATAAVTLAGGTVWPLLGVAALCVAAGTAAWYGWTLGLAAGIVLPLTALAFAAHVYHRAGIPVAAGDALVFALVGVAGLVALAFGRSFRWPVRALLTHVLPAAVVPAIVALFFALLPLVRDGHALSWAMQNDAVWNLVSARFVLADGGLIPSLHPNPSPLTTLLLAAGMAPGRPAAGTAGLLQHDIAAMAGFFAIATVAASFVAGLVAARMVSGRHWVLRGIAAVLASALIASWFVAGFSFQFGFYNVMPTLICVFACWLAWLASSRSPIAAIAVLLVAATALLALWAFLAAIPAVLGAAAAVRWLVHRTPVRWAEWTILVLAGVQVIGYAVAVSLPDLRRDQEALANGGSMAPVTPALLFILIGLCVAVAAATATGPERRAQLVGLVAFAATATAVYLYLGTKTVSGAHGWGYYPAKLVWFGGIVLMVILIGLALDRMASAPLTSTMRSIAVAGAAVGFVAVAGSVLPNPPDKGALVPYLDIARGTGVAAGDTLLPMLFAAPDPAASRTMAVGYNDWKADGFVNAWLLGASATSGTDPIRPYGYSLNTTDLSAVCDAVEAWGGPVEILTRTPDLAAQLNSRCPDADLRVDAG